MRAWAKKYHRRLGLLTFVALYALLLAGGLVRSQEAGMGCPDWPRCYGKWIPPLRAEALPPDYQNQYYQSRLEKNIRLATWLEGLGLTELSARIRAEAKVYRSEAFSPFKAWTEYLNRLLGLVVGILSLLMFVCALIAYAGKEFWPLFYTFLNCLGIVVAGGLGAIVVATHLLPLSVTLHMAIAFFVIWSLMRSLHSAYRDRLQHLFLPKRIQIWLWIAFTLLLMQLFLGTQLREGVDATLNKGIKRDLVLDYLGNRFFFHKLLATFLIGFHISFYYLCPKGGGFQKLRHLAILLLIVYLLEAAVGITLYYLALTPWGQPFHLFLAFIIYGLLVWGLLGLPVVKK